MHKATMTMSRPGRLFAIAATMLFVPGIAHALGLDNLTVYSALNEPLKAEIKFTSLSEKEFRTLDARLIKQPQDFNASALESAAPFLGVGITLVEREPGVYSLLLQSEQPMREPYLRLILEIEWAGGRLVREFTTLIDPRELRPPVEDGMPEFPSVAKVGDLGRQDSDEASSVGSKRIQTTLADKQDKSTPDTKQTEVLTGETVTASEPKTQTVQESTTETAISESEVAASPTPKSSQPTPSTQVSIETQRRLIQAEIENWARERGLSIDKEPQESAAKEPQEIVVSDIDVETLPDDDVATETPEMELDRPIRNELPKRAPVSPEASNRGTLGHDLLMGFIGLVVALILVAGGVLVRIYVRQHRALREQAQPGEQSESDVVAEVESHTERVSAGDVEELPEYGDRRSGDARRQQFIPVEVERRQQSRRHQDRLAQSGVEVDTAPANTMDESEVYMACGQDEEVELLLREALAKDPTRQDLKVKLLAIYQHRNDPEAFDALAQELYSNVGPKTPVDDVSETRVDERAARKGLKTDSDFDHSIDFEVPDGTADEAKDDNALDSDSPDDKQEVDADIFEREIEALAMTIPTNSDTGTSDSGSTPANENPDNAAMESLQVDDFAEIKQAVDRGVDLLEFDKDSDQDNTDAPQSARAETDGSSRESDKRSDNRLVKSKEPSSQEGGEQDGKSSPQWKEPSTKIDLAKAYIAMGDAERARSILDEVLEEWNPNDDKQD